MSSSPGPEARHASDVQRLYGNDRIEVSWEPRFCIHYAACIQGSPRAFDPRRRPWVDVDAEAPERIAQIVADCPTGALHARWRSGVPAETPPDPATIVPLQDGPLILHGRVQILDRDGNVIREDTRVALCRCGHSRNKPFCDDSHYRVGFKSADPYLGTERQGTPG